MITAKQKNLLTTNLNQVSRLWKVTDSQYRNGFARKIDVDRLYVSKVNLETQISNFDLKYEQLLTVLKHRMSMPLDKAIVLTDTLTEKNYSLPASLTTKTETESPKEWRQR